MDGCEGLTAKQIKILLNHTDNPWNQRRSSMKPEEDQRLREYRCCFCLDMVAKARRTKHRKDYAKIMQNHYNTCRDLRTFIAAAWTEEKVERSAAITEGELVGYTTPHSYRQQSITSNLRKRQQKRKIFW